MVRIDPASRGRRIAGGGTIALSACLLAVSWSLPAHGPLPSVRRIGRIGCPTCEGVTQFYSIADLALDEDNRLYVLDQAAPFVREFTVDGTTVRSFGSAGQGPGEFRTPSALLLLEHGGLEVVDVLARRRTQMHADGAPTGSRLFGQFPVAVARSGLQGPTYAAVTDFRSPTLAVEVWPEDGEPRELFRFDAGFPRGKDGEPSLFVALAASQDGRFAAGDGSMDYRIRVFGRDGRKLNDIVRDIARVRRTPAEMVTERERVIRTQARADALRRVEARRSGPPGTARPVEEIKPHFLSSALRYDPLGRLWVRTERGSLVETIFDVFDGEGRWLGEVRAGERIGRYFVGRDYLAGVTFDEDEVQYVSLYRVTQ
jgi:hypothetical protein